ncbi:nitroreductase family protein [Aquimarina rhabdastrellae]
MLDISALIRNRKTVYADSYIDKEIPKTLIEELITNALWAPTHKHTEPWRFIVLGTSHRKAFGKYMLEFYKDKLPINKYPPSRYEGTLQYPKNATMIAIIMNRSQRIEIPEWEEIAAVSCAVQNLWLSCTAHQIGCYWDSCEAAIAYGNQLDLKPSERCLGIFYMGYYNEIQTPTKRKRRSLQKKLSWDNDSLITYQNKKTHL